jgi:hypothetical protein
MPRKGPLVIPDIPLFLIPPVIRMEVREAGNTLERIAVKRCYKHFYNVSIHTRPVRRELRSWGP